MSTASLLGGVAVATAFHVYMAGERFYLVFAIWNGLQAIVLLLLSGKDGGGEFIPMPEKNAKRVHLFIAATITIVFVVYLTLVQEVYWSVVLGSLLSFWVVVESLLDKFTAGVDHRT